MVSVTIQKGDWYRLALFLRLAASLRYAARREVIGGIACPVGFARAKGARFTHGYVLVAANAAYPSE